MKRRKVDNLARYYGGLSNSDKEFLLSLLRLNGTDIHDGMLPFIPKMKAVRVLRDTLDNKQVSEKTKRKCEGILTKLGVASPGDKSVIQLRLRDDKVRRYGRGKEDSFMVIRLEARATVEAGLQWQEFGKRYIHPEVTVNHDVQLRRVRPNVWEVHTKKDILKLAAKELTIRFGSVA